MTHNATQSLIVGIDVAKDKLDVGRSDTESVRTVVHDAPAIAQLVAEMVAARPELIVLEATGGL